MPHHVPVLVDDDKIFVCALHSTDSEIRGVFSCVKQGMNIQDVKIFMGMPRDSVLPTPIYEDIQPCINVLDAKTVTSRV